MGSGKGGRRSGWPRRSALRRASDRLEAAAAMLMIAGGVAVLALAVVAGGIVADVQERSWLAGTSAVVAVTVEPPAPVVVARGEFIGQWRVPVRWTGPDGVEHTAEATLDRRPAVGEAVEVRVGPDGRARMSAPAETTWVGPTIGLWILMTGWLLLGLLWIAFERHMVNRNCRRWALEWARVEPVWSGRVGR